jgi:hypothetical protein
MNDNPYQFDENKHEIGYLQVYSHIRRRDRNTGKWVLLPNPQITRFFANKKHVGWVSVRDPELTKMIGESPAMDFDEDEWYNDIDSDSDTIDEQFQ